MIELKQTDTGIYYIHDYYPKRYRRITKDQDKIRKMIWAYKELEEKSMDVFTNELMMAITIICRQIRASKIGLIAVPPSKVSRESPIGTSIWNIKNWYDKGITLDYFDCEKRIYDYSDLLTRHTDISTAHEGKRASYNEQKESIRCSRDRLWKYGTTFIILDDVVTTGTSMEVCRDILVENGSGKDKIYRLAIAKTV